jgi:phosphoglycolate phosphatase
VQQDQSRPVTPVVLWDLDGTIMDSKDGVLAAMRHTLTVMGCPIPADDDFAQWIGPQFPTSLRRWTSLDDEGVSEAVRVYGTHYDEHGSRAAQPFPGIPELILALHDRGILQALATSKPCDSAIPILRDIGLLDCFVARGCASADESWGTKPQVMGEAIAGLAKREVTTEQMVMIGDRIHDFEAAAELGVRSVAVRWGYGNPEEWVEADHQVGDAQELADFFDETLVESLSSRH